MTQRGFVRVKVFYREHALAYPNHSFMRFGGPEDLSSTTIFEICGVKLARESRNTCVLFMY